VDAALITTGLGFHGDLAHMDLAASHKMLTRLFQVNCAGVSMLSQFLVTRCMVVAEAKSALSEANKKTKALERSYVAPTLLILSSFSGLVGLPHRAAYCSSKFALNGYLEALHAEFPTQVRMVLVCPTSVSTNFRDNWKKEVESGDKKPAAPGAAAAAAPEVNAADLTPEQCVASVLHSFHSGPSAVKSGSKSHAGGPLGGGIEYSVLPSGKTAFASWAVRVPWVQNYVRGRILNKSSKL
jgi:short-subunit dehydrogenase